MKDNGTVYSANIMCPGDGGEKGCRTRAGPAHLPPPWLSPFGTASPSSFWDRSRAEPAETPNYRPPSDPGHVKVTSARAPRRASPMMTSPMVFVVKQEPQSDDESVVVEAAVPVPDGAESADGGIDDVVAKGDANCSGDGGSCDKCIRGAPSSSRTSSERERVRCATCSKVLANRTTLLKHLRIHTGEKPYQCPKCNRCFRQKEHRDKHVHVHSTGKAFECVVCNMTFGRRHFLEKHMQGIHKMDMRSAFEQHAVIFLDGSVQVQPSVLELQVETIDDPPAPPPPPAPKPPQAHRCPVCRRTFSLRYNLRRHMRTQHGQTTNTCEQCGKGFKRVSGLRTHEIAHSDVRLYQCTFCGRCFSQKHHLMRHQLVHTPKINIVCSVCHKGFRYASTFFEHMAIHDAEEEMRKKSEELQNSRHEDAEAGGMLKEEDVEDVETTASSRHQQERAEDEVFIVHTKLIPHQEQQPAFRDQQMTLQEHEMAHQVQQMTLQARQVALQEHQMALQEQQTALQERLMAHQERQGVHQEPLWHQEDYVAIENLDLDCMFCGRSMLDPHDLYQHLLEHCRETYGADRDACWEIGAADEILGL
ncbi:hypothetical protein MTO96_007600 [Rhipicephalus appendiculatus]